MVVTMGKQTRCRDLRVDRESVLGPWMSCLMEGGLGKKGFPSTLLLSLKPSSLWDIQGEKCFLKAWRDSRGTHTTLKISHRLSLSVVVCRLTCLLLAVLHQSPSQAAVPFRVAGSPFLGRREGISTLHPPWDTEEHERAN